MMTTTYTDQRVSYPDNTGDCDEYIKDQIVVSAERIQDGVFSTDPFGDRDYGRFPGDQSSDAISWLVERGVSPEDATSLVADATRSRPSVLDLISGLTASDRGWFEVGQGATESVRRRAELRYLVK